MTRRRLALFAWAAVASAATTWTAGLGRADNATSRGLATPVTATWAGLPLRQVAARLGEIGGIAVVVDRRLDPDTSITLDISAEPLDAVLARVAEAAQADAAPYAGHVRLVPRGGAAALAAAEQMRATELRAAGASLRTRATKAATSSWEDGAVPRELVARVAAEAGIEIDGLDALPHDPFPQARLPALTHADRLDLLLAHFDRRVEWRLRPGPRGERPMVALVGLPAAVAPAPPALHKTPPRRQGKAAPPGGGPATYTLTVAAPLEELLSTLARRFGLELALDRPGLARAGVAPAEIVRLELKDVSREQLLDAICAPRQLTWHIEGDTLSVSAAR
jgi:hypothetical protein